MPLVDAKGCLLVHKGNVIAGNRIAHVVVQRTKVIAEVVRDARPRVRVGEGVLVGKVVANGTETHAIRGLRGGLVIRSLLGTGFHLA